MANDISQEKLHAYFLKTLRERIDALLRASGVALPDETSLSLACALNLLFLLRGECASLGDYITTLRALRATVGDDLIWSESSKSSEVIQ
jgi:hypothetical protein